MKPIILIPAYKPQKKVLSALINELLCFDIDRIVVVDDGSGPEYQDIFEHIQTMDQTTVLYHKTNLGKGAALRTGFRHVLDFRIACSAVVTVDADGQHLPEDVQQVLLSSRAHPEALIMGARDLKGSIPLKSLLGNRATYLLFRGLAGRNIRDTQTGLRAIPRPLIERLLELKSDRYAYELEMLLTCVHEAVDIREVRITTVYEDNNAGSSFKPVSDSVLVYKTLLKWWFSHKFMQLLKYSLSGIFSTIADFGTYIILIDFSCGIVTASVLARILSVIIHFSANKYFTFSYRDAPRLTEIIKYLVVVVLNLTLSILLIFLFVRHFSIGEVTAKMAAQMILFLGTYVLLNGFVFLREKQKHKDLGAKEPADD